MRGYKNGTARMALPKKTPMTVPTSPSTKRYPAKAADRLLVIAKELRAMKMPDAETLPTTIRKVVDAGRGAKALYGNDWPRKCAAIYRISTDVNTAKKMWKLAKVESAQRERDAPRRCQRTRNEGLDLDG